MKTIMVDMDDVITNGNFEQFLEEFLGEKLDLEKNKVYFRQELIRGREEEFKDRYQYQNLYEASPLIKGCARVLKKLSLYYDIYIVTSYIWGQDIINAEENLKNKFQYLKKNLPFIDPKNYIFTQNKSILEFDIRIDDRCSGLKEGALNLLFDAWSNQTMSEEGWMEKQITRVKNWDEIEKILLKRENEHGNM